MVDPWCFQDRVVPEGMSEVARQLEVGNHKRCTLNTWLSSGTSAGTFVESVGPYMNYSDEAGKKGLENRSSRFEPKILWISFSRGSGPPFRLGWVFLARTQMLSGIQFTTYFIDFLLWKRNDSSVVLCTWSWRGKPVARAQAGLRRENAER